MKLRDASVMDLRRVAGTLPLGSSIEMRIDNSPYSSEPHAWVWLGVKCRSGRITLDDSLDDVEAFIERQDHARRLAEARATLAAEAAKEQGNG